ncbi:MAG TPA: NHL repeat-containing protein [Ktedonobacteraceae bacterium]|nr:NHL repeat-containing protein [Ktedonobacteraceae bacterium]
MRKYQLSVVIILMLVLTLSLSACGGTGTTTAATVTPGTTTNQPGTGPQGLPLYCPLAVAVDRQDHLYISDNDNTTVHERIIELSPSGQELSEWHLFPPDALGTTQGPGSLAFDAQGNLYVIDLGRMQVVKVSPEGKILARWGSAGSGAGQFESPQALAVDSQGHVYVSDLGTASIRVEKFSDTGTYLGTVITLNQAYFIGLAVDSSDQLYVSTGVSITKFAPSGQVLAKAVTLPETDPAATATWMGLSISTRDDFSGIYMTMARTGTATYPRLLSMDLATGKVLAVLNVWKAGIVAVLSIALDSQGNLYAVERTQAGVMQIQKFSSTGVVLGTWKGTCSGS